MDYLDNASDYISDETDSLYSKTLEVFSKVLFLPQPELYFKLLSVAALSSVIGSKVLPRFFSYGLKGSGKSETTKFIARLRNQKILASKSSYASLRNVLNDSKLYEPSLGCVEGNYKEGAFLCWDNLRPESLSLNPDVYQMLLTGYSKSTAVISISSGVPGKNLDFDTFAPVIFSSVFPLHVDLDFDELHRRMLIIPHKPYESLTKTEKELNYALSGLESIQDRLEIDDLDVSILSNEFYAFWTEERYVLLNQYRRALRASSKFKESKLRELPSAFLTLITDLIANGLTLGAFQSVEEATAFSIDLHKSQEEILKSNESASELLLAEFISEATTVQRQLNQSLIEGGLPPIKLRVQADKVKLFLENLAAEGRLDKQIRVRERNQLMQSLGFRLDNKSWVEI